MGLYYLSGMKSRETDTNGEYFTRSFPWIWKTVPGKNKVWC